MFCFKFFVFACKVIKTNELALSIFRKRLSISCKCRFSRFFFVISLLISRRFSVSASTFAIFVIIKTNSCKPISHPTPANAK